ncbi:MAG: type transport system ATP-binding protein [Candidatus Woesearchaeota archaeon]|nr:type transport system ATP-binding protein [Candidatus Woesearchaeota archaeon]MDN5327773.1 type transport system ATP-binding protein [Candidatus Woesearchaeota archaeon]
MNIVELEHVNFAYGKSIILKDISLKLQKGKVIGILGESGVGKTTLLSLIVGLLKPSKGRVILNVPEKKIGFSFQTPSFFDELTVEENITYFARLYGLDKNQIEKTKTFLLGFLELNDHAKKLAKELSGGMKKRLDVILSLVNDPHLIILDEPVGELDPFLREKVNELISIYRKRGATIILTSHYLSDLMDICEEFIILKDKTVIFSGTFDNLLSQLNVNYKTQIVLENERDVELFKTIFRYNEALSIRNKVIFLHKDKPLFYKLLLHFIKKNKIKIKEIKVTSPDLRDLFLDLVSKRDTNQKETRSENENQINQTNQTKAKKTILGKKTNSEKEP